MNVCVSENFVLLYCENVDLVCVAKKCQFLYFERVGLSFRGEGLAVEGCEGDAAAACELWLVGVDDWLWVWSRWGSSGCT